MRNLGTDLPDRKTLSYWLFFSHGVQATDYRGPAPSSGGLQALELYLVAMSSSWLPAGLYHYERVNHALAQISAGVDVECWRRIVPSLPLVTGGSLLWVLVGDGRRVQAKYGPRGLRFLLLEAGHLMQNLCLVAASLGWATTPLGGFIESEVARVFQLPATDVVLYLGVSGRPVPD
jgi:SagB-type dehydrogenase family enzyme